MAKKQIGVGSSSNDGTGDTLRQGAVKVNANFNEIYSIFGDNNNLVSYANTAGIASDAQKLGGQDASYYTSLSNLSSGKLTNERIADSLNKPTGIATFNTFYGDLIGDVTGDLTGAASTSQFAYSAYGLSNRPDIFVGLCSATALSGPLTGNADTSTFAVTANYAFKSGLSTDSERSVYAQQAGVSTDAKNIIGTPDITVNDITSRNINSSGVVTATSFVGDGSGITGVVASGAGVVVQDSNSVVGTAATINFGLNLNVTPVSSGIVTVSTAGGVKDNGSWNAQTAVTEQLDSIATTNLVAEYILYFSHSTGKQAQKVLVLNNGSNSYSQEFGVVFDNNLLVSVGSSIFGGNLTLNATPESGITGTISWKFLRNDVS